MNERLWKAVFEDLSRAVDTWASSTSAILVDSDADVSWSDDVASISEVRGALSDANYDQIHSLMLQSMRGLMHSTLAVFDGATLSAEVGRVKVVEESSGKEIEGALHEEFVGYLFEVGKLT